MLEKDPNNEGAILGLSMIESNEDSAAYEHLITAFKINSNNPNTLLMLGEVYLQRRDFHRAENCASRGLRIIDGISKAEENHIDLKFLHSNLLVLAGKILHANDDFNRAFKYYEDASKICENNSVALHYLAVVYLHLRNYKEAEKLFEKVLALTKAEQISNNEKRIPNVETMKILAITKARMYKRHEALKLLDIVLENDRTDYDSYLEAAHLIEEYDHEKGIEHYTSAIELIEKHLNEANKDKTEAEMIETDYISPIYYNNLAVLYLKTDNIEKGEEYLEKAKSILNNIRKSNPNSLRLKAMSLSFNFNEACKFESQGKIGEATMIYKYIIKEEPYYVDAYLRLALLAKQRGSFGKAIEYAEKAAKYQIDKKPIIPF